MLLSRVVKALEVITPITARQALTGLRIGPLLSGGKAKHISRGVLARVEVLAAAAGFPRSNNKRDAAKRVDLGVRMGNIGL